MCAATAMNRSVPTERRVLLISGSPHPDGPTARLLDAFVRALQSASDEENFALVVSRFDCYKEQPLPCCDCRFCYTKDGCSLPDLRDFYAQLEAADILAFAAPVYNLSFPAPLKALIDRMQRYWSARFIRGKRPPIARAKRVILLTASGTDNPLGGDMLERQLKPVLTVLNARLVQSVHYTGVDTGRSIEPFLKQAQAAARDLEA